ncbi:MAG: hypothetical protein IIB99_11855 [Planctomycetes bacterium]|nr:hypothetical protein [Planctomycetota bacterium]
MTTESTSTNPPQSVNVQNPVSDGSSKPPTTTGRPLVWAWTNVIKTAITPKRAITPSTLNAKIRTN